MMLKLCSKKDTRVDVLKKNDTRDSKELGQIWFESPPKQIKEK